jgi:SAM-dependent methyltransferase
VKIRSMVGKVAQSQPAFRMRQRLFPGSADYWEDRYAKGGTSGSGSYGKQAEWKASVVNGWVAELGVTSVVDLGCGDGNQLALAEYPRYLGLDRSATAVKLCIERFADDPTKSFLRYDPVTLSDAAGWLRGDMTISLEVIFHLVEDEVFEDYMVRLFDSAERYVVICSIANDGSELAPTEKHRDFTRWIADARPDWELVQRVDPPQDVRLISSFFLYRRTG